MNVKVGSVFSFKKNVQASLDQISFTLGKLTANFDMIYDKVKRNEKYLEQVCSVVQNHILSCGKKSQKNH